MKINLKRSFIAVLAAGLTGVAALGWAGGALAFDKKTDAAVEDILGRYAADYEIDPSALDITFGIEVAGDMWTVVSKTGDGAKVTLTHAAPSAPTFYFTVDTLENLQKIDRGEMNFQTASVRAFSSDYAPGDVNVMEGFQPGPDFLPSMFSSMFHFWTRGMPEVIPFNENLTRFTHGSNAVVYYYQEGFRSGWIHMKPGEHANEDPKSQVNPFPTLLIITKGSGVAKIDGKESIITEGEALFIPKDISHEFWNPNDESMDGILLMFGEGA